MPSRGGGGGGGSFKSIYKPKNLPRQLPGLPAGLRRPCIAVRVVLINAHGRGGGGGGGGGGVNCNVLSRFVVHELVANLSL